MATTSGPLDLSQYISGVTDRAYQNWGRGDEMFNWAKGEYDKNRAVTDKVVDQALATGTDFSNWAKADRAQYEREGAPAISEQMRYAREYLTPERMAANRAGAITGSNITFDAAADMAKRALMGYGVDPSAGRFAGLDAGLAAKRAASAAGVGTKSDRDTEMIGQQLLANAIKTQQVLPGQAANEAGVSLAAGNQAVNAGLATTQSGSQTMGTPIQWAGLGNEMYKQWADAAKSQTDAGLRANEQQLQRDKLAQSESSGLGAALGAGAGILGMVGNFAMPGGGSLGGSLLSGLMKAKKGGLVKRFRAGGVVRGPVTDVEPEEDENIHRGYRPKVRDEPAREWREPVDATEWDMEDRPQSDSEEDEFAPQRYADGGDVDSNAAAIWGTVPLAQFSSPRIPSKTFDPQGAGYDQATLELEDMQYDTRIDPVDGLPHNPSRVPRTGMLLKGRNHPTFDLGVEEDRKLGYGLEMRDGRYYTQPFQRYQEGGEIEDEIPEDMPVEDMPMADEASDNLVPPEASPSGGAETDDVHALLNEGEFVIPKDVTSWYGEKYFQNLIQRAYKEKQSAQAQGEPAAPQQQEAIAMSAPTFESMGA